MRNNTVRIDQHAFNRGVDEILRLKPLTRIVRLALRTHADKPEQPVKGGRIVQREPR